MPAKPLVPNRRRSLSDPFEKVLAPPPNESDRDREIRLTKEIEAKRISDSIDEQIKQERAALKKKSKEVKILLLGQSESGKSTTLKQFQLLHSPAAFHAERIAWRSVIYLNLIRSIRRILEALLPPDLYNDTEHADHLSNGHGHGHARTMSNGSSSMGHSNGTHSSSTNGSAYVPNERTLIRFQKYGQKLAPLVILEEQLVKRLANPDDDEPVRTETTLSTHHKQEGLHPMSPLPVRSPSSPFSPLSPLSPSSRFNRSPNTSPTTPNGSRDVEPALRSGSNWKTSLSIVGRIGGKSPKGPDTGEILGWWEDKKDPVHVINACALGEFGMINLWGDEDVRKALAVRRVRMEESSGFYLNEIERITAMKWIPTDDDVLKARLKTLGVVEHTFKIKAQNDRHEVEWKIYDVGGSRNQRQAWAPYFEDVNAIIFLAPISAFDQVLAEDSRVNRLEDSLLLWRQLVSNRLLGKVNIILFLNKCDLLKAKLEAGVQLRDHMISYNDRPNDYESVSKYFTNKFGALHHSYTPDRERELFIHLTSVTDTRKTTTIIQRVRDIILRGNLKGSQLL